MARTYILTFLAALATAFALDVLVWAISPDPSPSAEKIRPDMRSYLVEKLRLIELTYLQYVYTICIGDMHEDNVDYP